MKLKDFVEINPHLLLNVKDNKVMKTVCLNEDCKKIYNDLSLENKNINEGIDIIIMYLMKKVLILLMVLILKLLVR